MARDVVTARDAAAPTEIALPSLNADGIIEKLNDALARAGYRRTGYSAPVRSLFQLAWAVASHKRSTQATVYHLAYALVCSAPEAGKALAECLKGDVNSFAVGCILKILTLGVSTGDAEIVPPSVDAVRWLGEAIDLAIARGRHNELQPLDLVRAVEDGTIPLSVRTALRAAARLGMVRGDAVLGPKSLPAPSTPQEIIQHIEQVARSEASTPGPDLANVIRLLEEFEQRISEDIDDQKRILGRIETALPRPPSNAWLGTAIGAVLMIGVATGLALTLLQPPPRATAAISGNAK